VKAAFKVEQELIEEFRHNLDKLEERIREVRASEFSMDDFVRELGIFRFDLAASIGMKRAF